MTDALDKNKLPNPFDPDYDPYDAPLKAEEVEAYLQADAKYARRVKTSGSKNLRGYRRAKRKRGHHAR